MNGAVGSGSDRPFHSGRPTERHLPSSTQGSAAARDFGDTITEPPRAHRRVAGRSVAPMAPG